MEHMALLWPRVVTSNWNVTSNWQHCIVFFRHCIVVRTTITNGPLLLSPSLASIDVRASCFDIHSRSTFDMVFSPDDKAIIKRYYQYKSMTPYKIWKENPQKNWDKTSVKRLCTRLDKHGTMERQSGSGRPRTAPAGITQEDLFARRTGIAHPSIDHRWWYAHLILMPSALA